MIYEELYILSNGKRHRVDLDSDTGITLKFESYLFGDLSKITCSHSYTFKIPLTLNNRRLLDNIDDIRSSSTLARKKVDAEFIQNGITVFKANLYIDSFNNDTCSAVLTWGVLDGLENMKNNDVSLRKIPIPTDISETCEIKKGKRQNISEFFNAVGTVFPVYNAGLRYFVQNPKKQKNENGVGPDSFATPLPCIPVYSIIQWINNYYGTKFNFGTRYHYDNTWNEPHDNDLIRKGIVPLVDVKFGEKLQEEYRLELETTGELTNIGANVTDAICLRKIYPSNTYGGIYFTYDPYNKASLHCGHAMQGQISGYIRVKLSALDNTGNRNVIIPASDAENIPSLVFQLGNGYGETKDDLESVDGCYDYGDEDYWHFDFFNNPLSVSFPWNETFYLRIDCDGFDGIQIEDIQTDSNITIKPIRLDLSAVPNMNPVFKIGVRDNLPDITAMNFMKSLLYMMGAFPRVSEEGEIEPCFFGELYDNLIAANIEDWSSKVISETTSGPSDTKYKISGLGRYNYYMTKSDKQSDEISNGTDFDVYESGAGCIEFGNEIMTEKKNIIQVPFYAPYLGNKLTPSVDCGKTVKFWFFEEGKLRTKEIKPAMGMATAIPVFTDGRECNTFIGMDVWNGFADMSANRNYKYLQEILANPIIITEKLNLNEFDLRDIDYSVPIYLNKYNSYFAIISITRNSKGECKCELIKLP